MAAGSYSLLDEQMTEDDAKFYVSLGNRVAALRKKHPMTQAQLAETLGISQQVLASYELGKRKLSASMIPKLCKLFGVSAEELLGMREKPVKPGPTPKLQHQIEQINLLPRAKRQFVMEMLDAALQQQRRLA